MVVVAYLTATALLVAACHQRVEHCSLVLAGHAAVIALVWATARWRATAVSRLAYAVRTWLPVAVIAASYKELSYLVPRIHPHDSDWQLAGIDRQLFGVDPTLWIERFATPWLTEFLQVAYFGYYFYPVLLGIFLWRKGWYRQLHYFIFVTAAGFYLSFIGYLMVPAIGPRFVLKDAYRAPLEGILLHPLIRDGLDRMEGITRDCFPSGHTALTLLVLYGAFRFHRRMFRWMLVPAAALILSTVYLRYHYAVDVIAGAALAAAIMLVGGWAFKKLSALTA